MKRFGATLTLFLLAPFVAELSIGDLPFTAAGAFAFVFFLPIYGGGAVLIREVVRRTGRGWPAILLLGTAYGVVEEGLALRSLTSPTIYGGLPHDWGGHLLGLNGTYTALQMVNHAVWSVAVPILITELFFGTRPYLRRPGTALMGLLFVAGCCLTGLTARTSLDPTYRMPLAATIALVVVVAALIVAAWSMPRRRPGARPAPATPIVFLAIAAVSFAALGSIVLTGSARTVLLPVFALLVIVGGVLARRWTPAAPAAVAAGAYAGHTAAWGITQPTGVTAHVIVYALLIIGVAAQLSRATPETVAQ